MSKIDIDKNIKVFLDEPLQNPDNDKFGHRHYVDVLKNIIDSCSETRLNIGLFGKWGVGKTTILNMLKNEIKDSYKTVMFDCWKYSNEPISLRRKFLLEVAEQIGDKSSSSALRESFYIKGNRQTKNLSIFESKDNIKESFIKLSKSFLWSLLIIIFIILVLYSICFYLLKFKSGVSIQMIFCSIFVSIIYNAVKILKDYTTNVTITESNENLESLEQFENAFKALAEKVQKGNEKIIIFIDDLDRCQNKKVIEILETIKAFMNIKNCIFIVACDDDKIRKSLNQENIKDKDYIDKIFQIRISIPPLRQEKIKDYAKELLKDLNINIPKEDLDEITDLLIHKDTLNPRKVKILLNNFILLYRIMSMRKDEGKYFNDEFKIDLKLLAKICVIQTEYPEIFYDLDRNNILLNYIDKVRRGEEHYSQRELKLLGKYFIINNNENTYEFEVKSEYRETIEYLNHTSYYMYSPEKIKSYIYLSQDNINAFYSDEYVENLQSMLTTRNAKSFVKLYSQTQDNDEKVEIFKNLIQRIGRFDSTELINVLSTITNKVFVDIIPEEVSYEFANVVINAIQQYKEKYDHFDIEGVINYIKLSKSYNKYTDIINEYVNSLSIENIDYSIKILNSIFSSVELSFDEKALDNFLIQLFEKDYKQIINLIKKYSDNNQILINYFTKNIFSSIIKYPKEYTNEEKDILAQYLFNCKEKLVSNNFKSLIEATFRFINDKSENISIACINILDYISKENIDLKLYVDDIINKLSVESNNWDNDDICKLIFNIILKLSSGYQLKQDTKNKFTNNINTYYNQGREYFIRNYLEYAEDLIKKFEGIDSIVSNIILNINSVQYYREKKYEYISLYINKIKDLISYENKNNIVSSIISILTQQSYWTNVDIIKTIYRILHECIFIIEPDKVSQLFSTFTRIINYYKINNCNNTNSEIVKLAIEMQSDLLNKDRSGNIVNEYFNNLIYIINNICNIENLTDISILKFEEYYTYLIDDSIRISILNVIIKKNNKKITEDPDKILNICFYYGLNIVNCLFNDIVTFINNNYDIKEKVEKVYKTIEILDYEKEDIMQKILDSVYATFDEITQKNIFNLLYQNYKCRQNTVKLFANGSIDSKYSYTLCVTMNMVKDYKEKIEYANLIINKIKSTMVGDKIINFLNLLISMKDNKYLENTDYNKAINEVFLYLLNGGTIQRTAALKVLLLYYNEQKFPNGMIPKIASLLNDIIKNEESLRKLSIDIAIKSGIYKRYGKEVNKLKDTINNYPELKTGTNDI